MQGGQCGGGGGGFGADGRRHGGRTLVRGGAAGVARVHEPDGRHRFLRRQRPPDADGDVDGRVADGRHADGLVFFFFLLFCFLVGDIVFSGRQCVAGRAHRLEEDLDDGDERDARVSAVCGQRLPAGRSRSGLQVPGEQQCRHRH